MTISWAANIVLLSHPSGLKVELTPPEVKPHFTMDDIKFSDAFKKADNTMNIDIGDAAERTCKDVFEEFKREFPSAVDLSKLISNLSRGLEGCWNGLVTESNELATTKPFFNARGDFLVDLCVRAPEVKGKKALNGGKNVAKKAADCICRPIVTSDGSYLSYLCDNIPRYVPDERWFLHVRR